jgi:LPPG:FO 2-phospho-L-lactate transferase
MSATSRVVALAGGTGGAKLAHGLHLELPAGDLAVIVNTGDDTERHGLLVMPDHDAVMYMLAGLADSERGWGLADETWAVIEMLGRYREETWFRLGDRDLATHIARTRRLRDDERLTVAVTGLQQALGITTRLLPMSDDPVRTQVETEDGPLEFQDYFVRLHQEPTVTGIRLDGIEQARATPEVTEALAAAASIVIGPSNPIVSIDPILAVPGIRASLDEARARGVRVVAVSPIVGGRALKGPADRMLESLGHEVSSLGVARIYEGLVDTFVLDAIDAELAPAVEALGMRVVVTDTVMNDDPGRRRLARAVLEAGVDA